MVSLPFIPYSLSTNDLQIDGHWPDDTLLACEIKYGSVSWFGCGWLCCL